MKKYIKKFLALGMALVIVAGMLPAIHVSASEYQGVPEGVTFDEEYYSKFKGQDVSISVYNWGEYIANGSDGLMDTCAVFTELTGIKVYYTTFATNEELYAKMKNGAAGYDVIVPSDYMVARMIEEDMVAPLNKDNIPNLKYVDDNFIDPQYDPGSMYSLPYVWGTVALAYNKKMVDEVPDSWSILWDEKYKGQILMFSNSRDAMAVASKLLGNSLNTEDPEELRAAADLLIEQKPLVQAYVMEQTYDKLENNEAALAPYYAGQLTVIMKSNPDIEVVYPKEGVNLFVDAACIPVGAKNKEAAEMFINFLNEPIVAAQNSQFAGNSTPNWAAFELLPDEIRNNKIAYPSQEVLSNSEQFIHMSKEANTLLDELWTEILSDSDSVWKSALPPLIGFALIIGGKTIYKIRKKRAHMRMMED